MTLSRRDFLRGVWRREEPGPAGNDADVALPPEFTPSLLRAEAVRLGLDVDALTGKELASAVMRAMRAQTPRD